MSDEATKGLVASFITLFPESIRGVTDASILGRAQKAGLLEVETVQLRDFAEDKHRTVDDTPCGGGPGMILRFDVVSRALDDVIARDQARGEGRRRRVIALEAAGPRFDQARAGELAEFEHLVFLCGRYEGFDARIHSRIDEVVSVGDFVLTGGELAALAVLDATARLVPGVLGNKESSEEESFTSGLLEHRQYTRPVEHAGLKVPDVLLSGDHKKIAAARRRDALARTQAVRPELLGPLDKADRKLLDDGRVPSLDPIALGAEGEEPA